MRTLFTHKHVGTAAPGGAAERSSAARISRHAGKSLALVLVLLALAAASPTLMAQSKAHEASSWKQIPIPPLPAFKPEQPKRIELSNGMVIFLQEDHELPLINGTARIRGGSIDEPANKIGLTDIYGEVWRTGGTKSQTGDQLDDFLEVRAAKV